MKMSGWFESEMEAAPRTRICRDVPAVPDAALTARPGTRDCSISFTVLIGASFLMSSAESDETVAACARRSWFPTVPVTTTSLSVVTEGAIAKSDVTFCPAVTWTVSAMAA